LLLCAGYELSLIEDSYNNLIDNGDDLAGKVGLSLRAMLKAWAVLPVLVRASLAGVSLVNVHINVMNRSTPVSWILPASAYALNPRLCQIWPFIAALSLLARTGFVLAFHGGRCRKPCAPALILLSCQLAPRVATQQTTCSNTPSYTPLSGTQGWEMSPFLVFVRTIPGRFYPIGMLALQLMLILTQRDLGPMFRAERRAIREGKVHADSADQEMVRPLLSLL
jgi:hypothetical protein